MPTIPTLHRQGDLVHPELVSGDLGAAAAFYGAVLGWDYVPGVVGPHYIATIDQVHCAGLAHTTTRTYDVPLGWCPYLAVDDVDKTCTLILEHGGRVVQPPADIGQAGRIAFAADLDGAVLGLWHSGPEPGTHVVGEPGTICAAELVTPDPQRAADWYHEVLGYELHPARDGSRSFGRLQANSEHLDLVISPQTHQPPRNHCRWLIYLGVDDLTAAETAAAEAGGAVVHAAEDSLAGRVGFIADRDGAVVGLLEIAVEGAR
ncbi:VOC family protein [Microbispora sp. NBRC 16548]|uniref:VOC family protein n=1 Tax=Microbispora sp. NBRC 16548 TaxID=3030994 RepID=UPI0024A293C1|nr:VOC family protein [Microbispora sp. NBRC 16548]GLX06619.1 putative glyoxylase CFP32 [Microbispora sp. NBRC 16548]